MNAVKIPRGWSHYTAPGSLWLGEKFNFLCHPKLMRQSMGRKYTINTKTLLWEMKKAGSDGVLRSTTGVWNKLYTDANILCLAI
jgi:hypothetical protein